MTQPSQPLYLHPLDTAHYALPTAFTYPFRYTPHPLCRRAAAIVQEHLRAEGLDAEGKMFGVLVVEGGFLAAYSGQLAGSYSHPWFVPPVFDYLDPEGFFMKEQAEIVALSEEIEKSGFQDAINTLSFNLEALVAKQNEAVEEAKKAYERGRKERAARRKNISSEMPEAKNVLAEMERESQFQKAEIRRAKQRFSEDIASTEKRITELQSQLNKARNERRLRSEALQQWLFEQFRFTNARGEQRTLTEIFKPTSAFSSLGEGRGGFVIPSGAGECCAPKLLNAAFALGLRPIAMAEFWWGPSLAGNYRRQGAFYPACNRKCRPILAFMLQGLDVEPDPALHYERLGGEPYVVWEDAWMAVVAKPTGWLSVPGKTAAPDICQWARDRWAGIAGPIVVHRLDQDTSGLLILAKTQMSYSWLQKMFEARKIRKRYVALLEGRWQREEKSGTISLPLAPDYDDLPRQRVDYERGLEAVTQFEILGNESLCEGEAGDDAMRERAVARVAFYPQTGRTHQLRLHASSADGLGMAIVGDRLYGELACRLYLHAEALDFEHPATGEPLHFELPAPF